MANFTTPATPATPAVSLCEAAFAAGDGFLRRWWIDPFVATLGFALSIWFFRACEVRQSPVR